ncbi:PREDICTED: myristoylated alanine-rich C-kinase substrate [Galeopterus variegatus]|uniref:Myristoylated alanine-rich C-kinase substrate n=1 Tax=Galeopterus variegatus TaxID=482537 RepID=A0ABM0QF64_GALVR|nr:PREDICTED: myristoylated alanine-rich C-kinase substrate [Galeopterus variegatus]
MGAQFSKTAAKGEAAAERPGEAAVASSPSKANGQENGHVKVNGDASPAAAEPGAKEELQANGSAPAADKEEPATAGSGAAAPAEEPAAASASSACAAPSQEAQPESSPEAPPAEAAE